MKLEYSNVEIENDPSNIWTIKFDLVLKGDTYQVRYDWNEEADDLDSDLTVEFEGVDQYKEYEQDLDLGYGGPHYGHIYGGYVDKDTYFSRNIDEELLSGWIYDNILVQIWDAQSKVIDQYRGGKGIFFLEDE